MEMVTVLVFGAFLGFAISMLFFLKEDKEKGGKEVAFGVSNKLRYTYVCVECDEVYSGREDCPKCLCRQRFALRDFLTPNYRVMDKGQILKIKEERQNDKARTLPLQTEDPMDDIHSSGKGLSGRFVDVRGAVRRALISTKVSSSFGSPTGDGALYREGKRA